MPDSDLRGEDLLHRIDELTNATVRDTTGRDGWRHLLYAAACELRRLDNEVTRLRVYEEYWRDEARDLRCELSEVERERDALAAELAEARDD